MRSISCSSAVRRRVAASLQELERRLSNARFYAAATAPGAQEESANSHALWREYIAELREEIAQLRGQLGDSAPECEHCGSVLSAVTWTCVRGEFCPGARPMKERR